MNPGLFVSRVSLPKQAQDRLAEARAIPIDQGINLFTAADGAEPISQQQENSTMQHQDIEDTKMERSNQLLYSHVIADVTHALNKGADPNHRAEFNDNAPLHQAARNGDVAIAKLLMERGANPNQTVIDNVENVEAQNVFTPLMVASTPEMVATLVEGGADVKQALWTEQTLDNPEVAHALLEAGMDANGRTFSTGVTNGLPALYACENADVAKDLVVHGADPQTVIRLTHHVELPGQAPVQVHDGFLRPDQRYGLDDGANKVIESKGDAFAQAIGTAPGQQFHTSTEQRATEDQAVLAKEALAAFRDEHPLRAKVHDLGVKSSSIAELERQAGQSIHTPQQKLKQEALMQKDIDYDKPMNVEETRAATKRAAPTLGAAVSGATMPKRHSTLGEAAAAATGKSEGDGQGGRQGGQERPSHSSYYSPIPVGGMAMPKRGSDIGDAVIQNEQAKKRTYSRSI